MQNVREDIQNKGVEQLFTYKNAIFSWSTGVGKTRPAIWAIKQLGNTAKVLIVVAERLHKNNWKQEFIDSGNLSLWKQVTIICYASLKNYCNTSWDLVVLDEVHHIGSDLRLSYISTIQSTYFLGLSATVSRKLIESLEKKLNRKFYISKIDLQEAIDYKILGEPMIYLLPMTLNTRICTEEVIEEWGNKEQRKDYYCDYSGRWAFYRQRKTTYKNATLHIRCTQQQKYSFLCEQMEYYKRLYERTHNKRYENTMLQWAIKRKFYLGNLKTQIVKGFLKKEEINNLRYICFCTNIEQADALGKQDAIHSKKANSNTVVKEFNEEQRNHLFAVGMAVEGVNLKNIEAGIIVQLDGEILKFYQKFGRTTRAKEPRQYIFYYKGTRDEEYLKKAIEGIDTTYIKQLDLYENTY